MYRSSSDRMLVLIAQKLFEFAKSEYDKLISGQASISISDGKINYKTTFGNFYFNLPDMVQKKIATN